MSANTPDRPLLFLCDDSRTIRHHVSGLLSTVAEVVAFASAEGLLAGAQTRCPDLILSDIEMGGMSGYQLCEKVRANEAFKGIPIILLTSKGGEDSKAMGLEIGADDYLLKPVNARELIARANSLIRLRRSTQQLEARTRDLETANAEIRDAQAAVEKSHADLRHEMQERQQVEMQLRLAQKLESIGRIAGGIAHEINTPIQFVADSCHFLREATDDIHKLVKQYQLAIRDIVAGTLSPADAAAQLAAAEQEADLPYLLENAPKSIERAIDGVERVATIVRAMKEFAHPDQRQKSAVNLNQAITSTLAIAKNEYKYVADLETDLGPLPPVTCHAGEINQAVLNMVVNAAHAIGDVVKNTETKGRIRVKSWLEGGDACVSIQDTGGGIPEKITSQIFEPFFTTKEVGKGTGQGLAIARSVVVEKHGGTLTFESCVGEGTTFTMRIPVNGGEVGQVAVAA